MISPSNIPATDWVMLVYSRGTTKPETFRTVSTLNEYNYVTKPPFAPLFTSVSEYHNLVPQTGPPSQKSQVIIPFFLRVEHISYSQ